MITRIIHQIGPDDQNQWPYIWIEGHNLIKKTFPNFKHFLWKNSDIYPFIERNYPQYYKLIDELPTITKCDFFRNILMHYYGGIYFDLDFLVYKNFYEKLDSKKPTIIEKEVIKEDPRMNHPKIQEAIKHAKRAGEWD